MGPGGRQHGDPLSIPHPSGPISVLSSCSAQSVQCPTCYGVGVLPPQGDPASKMGSPPPPPVWPHSRWGGPGAVTGVLWVSVSAGLRTNVDACGWCVGVRAVAGVGGCARGLCLGASGSCVCPQTLTTVPTHHAASRSAPTALEGTSAAAMPATSSALMAAGVRVSGDSGAAEEWGDPKEGPGAGSGPALCSGCWLRPCCLKGCPDLPACSPACGHWSLTGWGWHPWLLPAGPPSGHASAVTLTVGCGRGITQ